jgi:acetyltransferase-like isoleucine patch superfamily enzyme
MKERIKKIMKDHPILEKNFRFIKSILKNEKIKNRYEINGTSNAFNIDKSALLKNCRFDVIGNNNEIEIGQLSILNDLLFHIRGDNNKIKLGEKVKFNNGGSIWIEDNNGEALIGENTTFEESHLVVTEPYSKIHIGKDCMLAYDVEIRTGDSHTIIDSITNERINYARNIVIGNHVWIAAHVSILKGSCISDNSIVATRSVVTRSFEETNILIGGIPAKKIKENINWDRQRIYGKNYKPGVIVNGEGSDLPS